MHPSRSAADNTPSSAGSADHGGPPRFPVETDIFIQPDGSVVIADLPRELESLLAQLGRAEQPPAPS